MSQPRIPVLATMDGEMGESGETSGTRICRVEQEFTIGTLLIWCKHWIGYTFVMTGDPGLVYLYLYLSFVLDSLVASLFRDGATARSYGNLVSLFR